MNSAHTPVPARGKKRVAKTGQSAEIAEDSIASTSDKYRLQLEFVGEAKDRLVALKEESNSRSFAEVIREALRFYQWFLEKRRNGYDIALYKEGEPVRIVTLLS